MPPGSDAVSGNASGSFLIPHQCARHPSRLAGILISLGASGRTTEINLAAETGQAQVAMGVDMAALTAAVEKACYLTLPLVPSDANVLWGRAP